MATTSLKYRAFFGIFLFFLQFPELSTCEDIDLALLIPYFLNILLIFFKNICSVEYFEKIELARYNICLELYKRSKKSTERNARNFCPFLGIFTHVYQLIFRQISNQLARGYKTTGSHLKVTVFR